MSSSTFDNIDLAETLMLAALSRPEIMPDYLRRLCLRDLMFNATNEVLLKTSQRWLQLIRQFILLDVTMVNLNHGANGVYVYELLSDDGLTLLQSFIDSHVRYELIKVLLECARRHQAPDIMDATSLAHISSQPSQPPMALAATVDRTDLIELLYGQGATVTEQAIIAAERRLFVKKRKISDDPAEATGSHKKVQHATKREMRRMETAPEEFAQPPVTFGFPPLQPAAAAAIPERQSSIQNHQLTNN